jgi:putative cell wall-binding protein
MKTASLVLVAMVAVCLVGCENPELATCQQEKQALQAQADTLQQQLDDANTKIGALKAKNTEDQNIAMQSITTMMEKQAAADEKMKKQLAENLNQVKDLKAQNRIQQQRIEELEKQIAAQKAADETTDTATEDTM